MATYIFIAYKPDSDDYCRGCVVARYGSDFVHEPTNDAQRLAKIWGNCLFKNKTLDCNEVGYDIIIYRNGQIGYDTSNSSGFTNDGIDYDAEDWKEQEQAQKLTQADLEEILKQAEIIADQKVELKKAEEQAEANRKQQEEQDRRRAEFERLKKEFGS